jgi:hypothetical protein
MHLLSSPAMLRSYFKAIATEEINQNKTTNNSKDSSDSALVVTTFHQSVEETLVEIAECTLQFMCLYFANPFIYEQQNRRKQPFFGLSFDFQYYRVDPTTTEFLSENRPPIGVILEHLCIASSSLKKVHEEKKSYRVC